MWLPLLLTVLALQMPGHVADFGILPRFLNEDEIRQKLAFINETQPVGQVIVTVRAEESTGTEVNYVLSETTFFQIDFYSGDISLKATWDYEVYGDTDAWKQTLDITAVDIETDQRVISVEAKLRNINDNPPEFKTTLESDSIPEDQPIGYTVMQVTIEDVDQAGNAYVDVKCVNARQNPLDDTCEIFMLKNIPVSNFKWTGVIILNRTLDYETTNSYAIRLEADDSVHKVLQEFQVIVTDVNDSPPYYVRQNSLVRPEEIAAGTAIDYVSAIDTDENDRREIRYKLIGDPEALTYFTVSSVGGNITNLKTLDFEDTSREEGKEFSLTIKAMELLSRNPEVLGNDSITTAETTITIALTDVNDNCPTWSQPRYNITLLENVQANSTLPAELRLIDEDASDNFRQFTLTMVDPTGTFDYRSVGTQAPASIFLNVVNNSRIDYESRVKEFNLQLKATDNGLLRCTSEAEVKIMIADVNDETPEFQVPGPKDSYYTQVLEDAPGGTSIITVSASDRDSGLYGRDGFRFSFLDHRENLFQIDPRSGVVTVVNCPTPGVKPCLDYEEERAYILSVMVRDNEGNPPTNNAIVDLEIDILNVNDNSPLFIGNYTRRVSEGKTIPTPELIVKAVDRDRDNVTYTLVQNRDSAYWQINSETGAITAIRPITLANTIDGRFNFDVNASDSSNSATAKVTIIVIDENDNYPIFTQNQQVVTIPEDYPPSTNITTVTVRDNDSPSSGNGQVDVTIERGSSGKFAVRFVRNESDVWLAEIYTEGDATFDFDTQNQYILTLFARDKGNPPLTSSATLTVNILDINNKDPYIEPPTINVAVSENENIGYLVTVVSAKDRDKDAVLTTSFGDTIKAYDTSGQIVTDPNLYENLFALSPTGRVTVNQQLDRDVVSVMEYSLKVVDSNAVPPQTGTGSLFIRILEYNDQAPQFDLPLYELSILEERVTGTFVISLLATDEDDQIQSYQLSSNPGNLFAIDPDTGVMTVNGRLDYEAPLSQVVLQVTAFDSGSPQRSNTTRVIINIININDNAPVFTQPIYEIRLMEMSNRTDTLTRVSANDADLGDFGEVRYAANDQYFMVDNMDGSVTLRPGAELDRETFATHVFQVTAYDSPNNASVRLNTTSQVYVILDDINDNCPEFKSDNQYTGDIIETAFVGDQVMELFAVDMDFDNNRSIRFSIENSTADAQEALRLFEIQSRSPTSNMEAGRIVVRESLRNQSGVYHFTVVASDQNGLNLTGDMCQTKVNVTVNVVTAINDAPEWVLPPSRNFSIDVLESQYEGMLVYDCHARDKNKGKEGIVDYFFRSPQGLNSTTNEFRINQVTGVISATIVYDREQVPSYVLTVVAKDQGNPSASSETVLIVNVLDVNDNEPRFPMRNGLTIPLEWSVTEGKPAAYIGTVSATDRDTDHKNNKVYYRIVAGNDDGLFELDRETGNLTLSSKASNGLDRESKGTYYMDVLAYNDVSDDTVIRNKRSTNPSIVTVIVTVDDVNDSPPEFQKSDYYGCVPRDAAFGQSILRVEAVDKDVDGRSTYINYTIVSETTDSYFTIDTKLGEVRNAKLLYNINSRVPILRVMAMDNPPETVLRNSAETEVKIFVTDRMDEVKLKVSQPPADVRYYKEQLIRAMVNTSAERPISYVCIREIRDHVDENGDKKYTMSDVFLSAVYMKNDGSYSIYSGAALHGILNGQLHKYQSLHVKSVAEVTEEEDSALEEDAVLAIFIIAILLIFLAIILFCLACCLIRNSKKKKMKKLRAEERRPPMQVMHQPAPEVVASNPVYDNQGFVEENNDYAVVQKKRPPPAEAVGPPIVPVMVPALESQEPYQEEPNPVIITEPVMAEEDQPEMQPAPENFFVSEPEPEVPRYVTEPEEADVPRYVTEPEEPEMPSYVTQTEEPEPVIITEVPGDDDYQYPAAPEPSAEDAIDVEFRDIEGSPSPPRTPSPPSPPDDDDDDDEDGNEYRIETNIPSALP